MLSGQTWILALIFFGRSFCHYSTHETGLWLTARLLIGHRFIISPENFWHNQPDTVNKTFPATPPCLCWLLSNPRERTALWFTHTHTHKNCHSCCKHRKGRSLPCYFIDVYLAFPNMSFKYNQAAPRASKRYIIQCLSISLSPTLSTSACPLSSFVSAVLHLPLIFSLCVPFPCAATWTVSAACNTNYCAVFRSGKQRGEIPDVWTARLFSTLHPFFCSFFSCVTRHPGLFVKFWLFIAVCGILISSYI